MDSYVLQMQRDMEAAQRTWTAIYWTIIIIYAIAGAGFCAYLAKKKGRDAFAWCVLGFFFAPFALLTLVGVPVLTLAQKQHEDKEREDKERHQAEETARYEQKAQIRAEQSIASVQKDRQQEAERLRLRQQEIAVRRQYSEEQWQMRKAALLKWLPLFVGFAFIALLIWLVVYLQG